MKSKNSQEYCDYFNARREMESTHKTWMETSTDCIRYPASLKAKDRAREAYALAYTAYTGHGVIC